MVPVRAYARLVHRGKHLLAPCRLQSGYPVPVANRDPAFAERLSRAQLRPEFPGQRGFDIALHSVVEESEHRVEFALRQRVVLVVVALGAAHGKTQPRIGDGVEPVDSLLETLLGILRTCFAVLDPVAQESGCNALLDSRERQEVASDLLDREAVVRHVAIKRVDHPMPPPPSVGP